MKNINKETTQIFEKRNIYKDDDSGKVFLISLIAPFVMALLFSLIASQIAKGQEVAIEAITETIGYYVAFSICTFLLLVSIVLFYNKSRKISFSALNINFKMKWHTYCLMIGIGIISLLGIQYFIGAFDNLLKLIGYPLINNISLLNPTSWGKYFLALFALALLPAIGEELVFRGVIFHGLRTRFNDISAVLLSALMFALMHQSLQQLLYPFILGCIMGWVVLRTGSLVSSIIIHFVNNFLVVTFTFVENMTGFSLAIANVWWFYLIAILLLFVSFAIYFIIDRFYFRHESKVKYERTSEKTSVFVYISLAVGILLFVLATIIAVV